MTAEPWTIAELSEQDAAALAATAATATPASGRVREVPDARTIRWYQTTGLIDRPTMRGRTATYGPRHLLQLLAIKRLQAHGQPLADIQAALAGASDEHLARLVDLPWPPSERPGWPIDVIVASGSAARTRFWAPHGHTAPAAPAASQRASRAARSRGGAAESAALSGAEPSESAATEGSDRGQVAGLRLGEGVLLVLDGVAVQPTPAAEQQLRAAAQPLLATLEQLGFLPRPGPSRPALTETSDTDHHPANTKEPA